MDRDGLIAVAEDLQYLRRWGPDIANDDVRRGSAVLRRLLVENAYGTAWRAIGQPKQPKLIAVHLANLVGTAPLHEIDYGLAAGANFRGIQIAGMVVRKGTKPVDGYSPPLRPDGYPGEKEYSLTEFLSSSSGVVEGREFTRRDVIKYIANVKGGVHLSAKQRRAEEKLITRLGKIEKKMSVQTTDGLLVELVAIGQALGTSSDADAYVEHVVHKI